MNDLLKPRESIIAVLMPKRDNRYEVLLVKFQEVREPAEYPFLWKEYLEPMSIIQIFNSVKEFEKWRKIPNRNERISSASICWQKKIIRKFYSNGY